MILVRIVAPHFVAGLETNSAVRRAASILHYMVGWPDDRVRAYVKEQLGRPALLPTLRSFSIRKVSRCAGQVAAGFSISMTTPAGAR